jgi:serine/threonine protein phosphatase PrpC
VVYLRNTISKIIQDWFQQQQQQQQQQQSDIRYSFDRSKTNKSSSLLFSEFSMKNKRRIMEDKVSIIENINIYDELEEKQLNGRKEIEDDVTHKSLYAVFDGHCGVEAAQYVSTHLPQFIIQKYHSMKSSTITQQHLTDIFLNSFQSINERLLLKSTEEVNY